MLKLKYKSISGEIYGKNFQHSIIVNSDDNAIFQQFLSEKGRLYSITDGINVIER